MARYPGGGGPTDGGGGTSRPRDEEEQNDEPTDQEPSSSDTAETTIGDIQDPGPGPGDSPEGGGSTDDGGGSSDPPEDVQDSGPGPGDSPEGGGSTGSGGGGGGEQPPDGIQDSGPGPGDSPSGGGSTGGGGGAEQPPDGVADPGPGPGGSPTGGGGNTGGGQTDRFDRGDPSNDGSDVRADAIDDSGNDSPPDGGPDGGPTGSPEWVDPAWQGDGPDGPDRGFDTETSEDEREAEEWYVEQVAEGDADALGLSESELEEVGGVDAGEIDAYRQDDGWAFRRDPEHTLDELADERGISEKGIDVEQTEEGLFEFSINERGAQQLFADSADVHISGTEAERDDDGEWDVQLTESGREEWLEENYEGGPTGAGEQISGESGISDEGSPNDPLEGTGIEGGFGATADLARDIEDQATAEAGTAGGRQDPGESPDVGEDDIEVAMGDDGTLRIERARGTLTAEQAQNIDDTPEPEPQDPRQLERQTTSGVTPDYTTDAVNRTEEQIANQLEEHGVDPENVDINARVEDGEVRAGGEDRNDQEIRFPSADDTDTAIGRTFDAATAPILEPFGVSGAAVAGEASDAAGIGGQRLETVLDESGADISQYIGQHREPGGEIVQATVADHLLGPFATGAAADDVGDLAVAAADDRTEIDVEQLVEERSGDVYVGAGEALNPPELALTAKNAAEYAGFAAEETAEGDAGVVVDDMTNRAAVTGAQASIAFEENPQQFTAQLGGTLVAGAATGGVSSAAGVGLRVPSSLRGVGLPGSDIPSAVRETPGAFREGYRAGREGETGDTALRQLGREIERAEIETRMGAGPGSLKITRRSTGSDSKTTVTRDDLKGFGSRRGASEGSSGRSNLPDHHRARRGRSRDDSARQERIGATKIANAEPDVDLRRLDQIGRDLLDETDGRTPTSGRWGGFPEAAGVTLTEVQAGEGVSDATIPATFGAPASTPSAGSDDVEWGSTGAGESVGEDTGLDTPVGTGTSPSEDAGLGIGSGIGQGPGDDIGITPDEDTGIVPGEDTGTAPDDETIVAPGEDIGTAPTEDVGQTPVEDVVPTPDTDYPPTPGTGTPFDDGGGGPPRDPDWKRPFPRFPDLDSEQDDDDGFGFGGWKTDDKVFDTGVVQSIDEAAGTDNSGNGGDGDVWDFDGF